MSREIIEATLKDYLSKEMPAGTEICDPLWWADRIAKVVVTALAQTEQEPTVPDNMQDWTRLDGMSAWHLIERHADNWADIGKMMNEYIAAKVQIERETCANLCEEWYLSGDVAKAIRARGEK